MEKLGDVTTGSAAPQCWCGRSLRELVLFVTLAPIAVALRGRCDLHDLVSLASSPFDQIGLADLLTGSGALMPSWESLGTAAVTLTLATASLPIAALVLDPEGHALASNEAWSRLSGLTPAASQGGGWAAAFASPDPASVLTALSGPQPAERLAVSIVAPWPLPAPSCVLVTRPLAGPDGDRLGHLVTLVPVGTEGVAQTVAPEPACDEEARDVWVARMDEALVRHHGLPTTLGLLLMQVDVATDGNDREGPEATPEPTWLPVLDEGATRDVMRRVALVADTVDLTTHLGHGRFALLAQELTSYHEAVRVAGRLIENLAHPLYTQGATRPLRASVGVAFPHLPGDSAEALMTNAERAVELARSLGGNRFEVIIGTGPGSSDAIVAAPVSETVNQS
jgi:GGDEF domain-containing protein